MILKCQMEIPKAKAKSGVRTGVTNIPPITTDALPNIKPGAIIKEDMTSSV